MSMKCEKCGERDVTTHLVEIINGHKTDKFLCDICASVNPVPIKFDFEEFLGGMFNSEENIRSVKSKMENVCNQCGMTYAEFAHTGKLGCSFCYESFRQRLDRPLRHVHGSSIHVGKRPKKKH